MSNRILFVASLAAMAAVSSVAFAEDAPAPAPAAAPAAPAAPTGPTLAKVLDASGLVVTSYIDLAYDHANRNIESSGTSDRVFDSQNDSLSLHQVGLQIAKQPKEGFGGLVNFTAGTDVPVIASYPSSGGQFDVTQAFGQYASGEWTVIAGKFTTLQGTEVIWAPSNNNFSRSILFGAIPFTHTGMRVTYALSDTVSLIAGINNGWDQVSSASKSKTGEFAVTLNPIKPLNITISDYVGNASTIVGGASYTGEKTGVRNSANVVASYAITDAASVGVEYLMVSQSNFISLVDGSTIKAKYDGEAVYGSYLFTPAWRLALRAESFNDKDGFHFGSPDTKYTEVTATVSWLASDNFELRGEVREDHGSHSIFVSSGSTLAAVVAGSSTPNKNLLTLGIEALFKF